MKFEKPLENGGFTKMVKSTLLKSVTCIKYGTDVKIYVAKRLDQGKWAPFCRIATKCGKIYFRNIIQIVLQLNFSNKTPPKNKVNPRLACTITNSFLLQYT